MNVAVYVLTFNSPSQLRSLINSYIPYSGGVFEKTTNYIVDNSTDLSTTQEYLDLCTGYNLHRIKKDNIGICGGRQFIAQHFDESNHDAYIFLEDDMMYAIPGRDSEFCQYGFRRFYTDLFPKVCTLVEQYDFVKFCFSEFFGNNGTQWAWYNVPQHVRLQFWPENPQLPYSGEAAHSPPQTVFKNIRNIDGLPYADGEVYYCNWPQIVSRAGNKKMFIDTTWAHPYEQTWMSHIFQLHKQGTVNGAVLLASPIVHNRFDHYDGHLRKES